MSSTTDATGNDCEPKICEVGGGGNFLPIFGDAEQEWNSNLRGVIYLVGLLYIFLGVAIVADLFMGAIETITSKKVRIKDPVTGRNKTVKVWNATVANLTLMALGSSAPEILLSVIELASGAFFSGELGPSTIVGSAAFNMHVIIAVCVATIPSSEVRSVADLSVFTATASFSILAYLWLYFIVLVYSRDIIEVWEGAVTFVLFPVLVAIAYAADRGYLSRSTRLSTHKTLHRSPSAYDMTHDELATLKNDILKQHGPDISDESVAHLMDYMAPLSKSRAAYRIDATRQLFGGKRIPTKSGILDDKGYRNLATAIPNRSDSQKHDNNNSSNNSNNNNNNNNAAHVSIEFAARDYAVLENVGDVKLVVRRRGAIEAEISVDYKTIDDTAHSGADYAETSGTLTFKPGARQETIYVPIIDDEMHEPLETFFVELSNAQYVNKSDEDQGHVDLGKIHVAKVAIIDDDHPGKLRFRTDNNDKDSLRVHEGTNAVIKRVTVERAAGSRGTITCKYATEDVSAMEGDDYVAVEGELQFTDGQVSAEVEITILPRGRYETSEEFRLVLSDATGGARFDAEGDGGPDSQILTIIIVADPEENSRLDRVLEQLKFNYDQVRVGHASYRDQFRHALLVNGGEGAPGPGCCCHILFEDERPWCCFCCEEEYGPPTCTDYAVHCLTVFWKLTFAFIPPAEYCGGWLCFIVSLIMIGLVTALIGDLAALLGCVLGIPDSITAITFVALGTSLPDTFASKAAAEQDETADASIGNVTGSNSVNVFLGLGLPWFMGSLYWHWQGRTESWKEKYEQQADFNAWNTGGGKFIVVGGDLGFSVGVFSITAIVNLAVLCLRRHFLGGELGGPAAQKWISVLILVALWLAYVGLSSWKTLSQTEDVKCS